MSGVRVTLNSSTVAGGQSADSFDATTPANAVAVTLTNTAVLFQGVTDSATGNALNDRVVPFHSIKEIVNH